MSKSGKKMNNLSKNGKISSKNKKKPLKYQELHFSDLEDDELSDISISSEEDTNEIEIIEEKPHVKPVSTVRKSAPINIPLKKPLIKPNTDVVLEGIIKTPGLIIVNGKSKRGKSYLIKYIITCLGIQKKFKFGYVFCKTKFNGGYDFFPENRIIEGYNEEVLKKFLDILKKYGEENPVSDSQKEKGVKTNIPPSILIFDDLIGSLDTNNKFFTEFVATYRHYNISVIIATQYINKLSTLLREQAELCFMFEPSTERSIKALFESYGQSFDSFKKFKDFLMAKTKEPFHCLIYNENGDEESTKYIEYCAPGSYPDVTFSF